MQATDFTELKARQARAWSSAPFEHLADTAADIHDSLVARLGVRPGERWLDLATGTGPVAVRAARLGAEVTAQDLAPGLVETARRLAAEAGVQARFEVGDCERLPYPGGSFDVVCSAQGAVFAPDHRAVARELARVCRPGGRMGLTAWRPGGATEEQLRLMGRFSPPPPTGAGSALDWGRREYVHRLLGGAFELEFHDDVSPQHGPSAEALCDLFLTSFGPLKVLAESIDAARRHELQDALVAYFARYPAEGGVAVPREYVVVTGIRRAV